MNKYDDIIDRDHHVSRVHPPIPVADRAAQFAPFAALTGFGAAITETARRTEAKIQLDECAKAELDEHLRGIEACLPETPAVSITYFVADEKKDGGAYVTVPGRVKKLDSLAKTVVLTDGTVIFMDDIYAIVRTE